MPKEGTLAVSGAARAIEHRHAVVARVTVDLHTLDVSELCPGKHSACGQGGDTHAEGVAVVELVARAVAGDVQASVAIARAAAEGGDAGLRFLWGKREHEC